MLKLNDPYRKTAIEYAQSRNLPPITQTFFGCQPAARGRGDVTWLLRSSAGAAETSGAHLATKVR
jgi:hypothetical protein